MSKEVIAGTPTTNSAVPKPVNFKLTFLVTDKSFEKAFPQEGASWSDRSTNVALEVRRDKGSIAEPQPTLLYVQKTCDVPRDIYDALWAITQGKLPAGSNLELAKSALDADGRLKLDVAPPVNALPDDLKKYCSSLHNELFAIAHHWAHLLRWRLGSTIGRPQALDFKCTEFSMDAKSWYLLVQMSFRVVLSIGQHCSGICDDILSSTAELRDQDKLEPISRAMFREAWNLMVGNPRSALMIGYAAVETGCKEFISDLVPDASWLAMEAPTPPVAKILKDYLPKLPARLKVGGNVIIPGRIRRAVSKAMEARNILAHSGRLRLSDDELRNTLRCFNDLLWLLDYYKGHAWALNYISQETRAELPN